MTIKALKDKKQPYKLNPNIPSGVVMLSLPDMKMGHPKL